MSGSVQAYVNPRSKRYPTFVIILEDYSLNLRSNNGYKGKNMRLIKVFTIAGSCLVIAYCLNACSFGGLDDNRTNISVDEAQKLVPFTICFPNSLPTVVEPNPIINYYADYGDSPEKYIVLNYISSTIDKVMLEIWQRYDPGAEVLSSDYSKEVHEVWKYQLIRWLIPDNARKVDELVEQAVFEEKVFRSDATIWWLYSLNTPLEYFSTLSRWNNRDHISFVLYSYLSPEELLRVTESLLICSQP